ncbi:unnamed protein product [Paramecium primaurelia]|uniref:DoxX family protein n=1 Tax=Paramecium primaurelia TaxID=5886 RepID=A0A8S1PW39_PARPR|nr:unnamed protein product [Paramecium primaurelia]
MKFSRLIGRILLALLFINAGLSQLNNTDPFVQFVNVRYPFFYDYVQKLTGHSLDCTEILKPTNFIKHTPCLIQTIGAAQIILGLGVVIGMQGAGCLLALLSVIITVFAHNPIIYLNNVNAQVEYLNIIFNVGIIGALFLVGKRRKNKGSCGVGSCLTAPKEDKKDQKKEDKKEDKIKEAHKPPKGKKEKK